MFNSVILGLGLSLLSMILSQKFFEESRILGTQRAAIGGVMVIFINYLTIKAPAYVAVLFFPLMLVAIIYTLCWCGGYNRSIWELLISVAIILILSVVLANTAVRVGDLTDIKWLIAVTDCVFSVSALVSIGILLAKMLWGLEIEERYERIYGGEKK